MKVTTLSASLVYFLATTSAVSAYHPQPPNVRVGIVQARDANYNVRRHVRRSEHALPFEKRAPIPQIGITPSDSGNNPPPTQSTSSTSSQDTGGNGNTSSSTTPPAQPPPTTTSSSSTPPPTDQPNTTSSTTSNAPQTSSTITTTINTSVTTTGSQGTTIRNTNTPGGTTRTASQGTYTVRGSQTSSSATSTSTSTTTPFMKNKGAVAATVVVVSLVAVGALVFVGFWLKKKNQRGKMGDDTWDEASMKEFPPVSRHGAGAGSAVVVPPPLMTSNGLGRSNTVLPSQSAGASPLARTKSHSARSHEDDPYGAHSDEPDEILAMPPVKNYERPRDSAFDIVPPPPPAAVGGASGSNSGYSPTAYSPGGYNNYGYGNAYASTSANAGGLEPPKRKGDHTSYGSGVGVDPFAGTGFVDATREASYGQAGHGAGYGNHNNSNAAYGGHYGGSDEDAYDGNAVAGPSRSNYQTQPNQWGQAYNPYQGYGQASGSGSKGGYGGYGYAS